MLSVVCAVLAGVVGPGNRAVAQTGDQAKAEDLIRQANELRRRNENVPAFRLYQQAYELSRNPRTAAQLALSEISLGYWLAAHDHLTEALTSVSYHPWIQENRKTLETQLADADSHIAEVTIEGKPDGAEVLMNGKRIGALPLPAPIKVSEGRVDFEVRAPGHTAITRNLTLAGSARERVTVTLAPAAPETVGGAAPAPAGDRAADRPGWRATLPWIALGVGAAAAGIGIWQHVAWRQSQQDFEAIAACGEALPMHGSDSRCQGHYDDLTGHRRNAYIAYGTAAVLGGAATALFILNASSRSQDAGIAPGVAVGPGMLFASCRMAFW